jgi:polyisoprenoid-binding protein YceI
MMKIAALLLIVCAGCGGGAARNDPAPAGESNVAATDAIAPGVRTFVIVPKESRASYHANEEFFAGAMKLIGIRAGKAGVVGSTQSIKGQFQLDPSRPASTPGTPGPPGPNGFTVEMTTLTSNQKKRDDYLREIRDDGPSFDAYPSATFVATAIDSSAPGQPGDIDFQMTGELTVREVTRRVVFDVKARVAGDTFAGVATTDLRLSDFGIGPITFANILTVADPVQIEVVFTARAKP